MSNKWEFEFLPKDKEPKELAVAYWLFFALGTFGVHHFYLGQKKRAIYILVFVWLPILVTKFTPLLYSRYVLLASVLLVGPLLIFDLLTLFRQVHKYNDIHFPDRDKFSVKV